MIFVKAQQYTREGGTVWKRLHSAPAAINGQGTRGRYSLVKIKRNKITVRVPSTFKTTYGCSLQIQNLFTSEVLDIFSFRILGKNIQCSLKV